MRAVQPLTSRCTFAYQVGPVAFHGFSSPTLPLDHEEAEGKSSAFEDCCLGYQHRIKWNVLRHARNYHQQEVSGSCNLRAVRFYFRQKVVCGNPEDMNVKRAMRILTARKRLVHWKSASDSQTERKKSNHMKSKVENPNSTSVRSATLGHPRMVMMPRKTNN
ncbi:C-C motif chemokine 25 isoform X5 [Mus musculus]|uniref:C-C motif chemokine 25 isoform X5 n=1 Tax=Mus musculus TaxID=10090 RepID=UPI0005ABA0AF|nr:C-C motif chemokine 25 isoform X5 [Mus musculus]|eukprot:XP_011240347.1 PREDICTED: C-C motif chemokine 25 isoform X3 [Mus musculus]